MSSRASPVPSLSAVLSCAVENIYACDLPQWFHVFFASRSCFKHKYIYIHIHIYIHMYINIYTCMYIYTCLCVCVCVCVWEGEEEGWCGVVGGWVGEYVLVCVLCLCLCVGVCAFVLVAVCVVCADSLRSVPQDKNGAQQLHQVKRMIGGLGNVLFTICSQTLNG